MNGLDRTYRTHRTELHRYIKSKVADNETADDILQEVFERAAHSINLARPIENLVAWLFAAASNRIIDWYRFKYRTEVSTDDESLSVVGLLATSEIDLHDELVRDSVIEELYIAIDELPAP